MSPIRVNRLYRYKYGQKVNDTRINKSSGEGPGGGDAIAAPSAPVAPRPRTRAAGPRNRAPGTRAARTGRAQ
ncbi:unnamed protein product [Colias eurytheme]|nr:unnamed protein product [Colias eurytheme]